MCEIKNTIDKDALDKSNKSFDDKVIESINKIKISEYNIKDEKSKRHNTINELSIKKLNELELN